MKTCICGRLKPISRCCGRFLSGKQNPKTPKQLMRSRYTAYALGGYGEYLLSTWLPATAIGLTASDLSEKSLDWQRLEIISSTQKGKEGTVEFKAWFKSPGSEEQEVMHEVSEFVRIKSRWYYVGEKVSI